MAVTIRDVASAAGVSFKTVSNVVNDFPHVAPATRARVLAAIEELGYRPNQAARHLRHGTSGFLGLVLPEIVNPYFSTLASLIGQEAKQQGWTVVVEESGTKAEQEQQAVHDLSSRLVDGVIFSPTSTPREAILDRIGDIPLVLLGEWVEQAGTDHVAIDNVLAARQLTEHLLATGARRIATIGYREGGVGAGGLRWLGHMQALMAADVPADPALAAPTPAPGRAGGYEAMADLLRRAPDIDGVLAMNDVLALGALRALHDAGVSVPHQVVVAGFDDIEDAGFSHPRLTSVAPDVRALARESVEAVLRRVRGSDAEPRDVTIPFTIVARESTARTAGN